MWGKFLSKQNVDYNETITIYHFGFSEDTNSIKSYAYRSANEFKSESLQFGIGVKPECNVKSDYELPKDIPNMMKEQRLIQSKKPLSDRVYIGGEIMIYHLESNGICIYSLGKFDDFYETQNEIITNYSNKPTK